MGLEDLFASFVQNADDTSLTFAWILSIVLLSISLLGTWKFIPMIVSNPVLGIFMIFGGLMMFTETFVEGGFSFDDKGDIIGLVTLTFSILYGAGLIVSEQFLLTHFGGVQGGVLLFLIVDLIYEGVGNRS